MEKRYIFDKIWFKEHQRGLLWFANSIFGKIVFRNGKMGLYKGNNALKKGVPFIKITPNSVAQYVWFQGRIQIRENFWIKNEYSRKLFYYFYPVWMLFHIWDTLIANNLKPAWNLGFDTLTVYPDTGTEGTTGDAQVYDFLDQTDFSTVRNTTTGYEALNDTSNMDVLLQTGNTTNTFTRMDRSIMTFDTSSLTASATISSAVLSLYYLSKKQYAGKDPMHICQFSGTNNRNFTTADFSYLRFGTTSFASIEYDSFVSGYNDFTLNSSGVANVSKTGISKFGARLGWDINNSFTGTWNNLLGCYYRFYAADYGSNKPKLVVTYTSITAPTVTTQSCDQIAKTSVQGNGNITATGGANATRRGFCYKQGTTGDPTTSDSVAYDDGDYGTGAYTKTISGLTKGTTYRVRAYAVNSAGTSYGDTVSVTTVNDVDITKSSKYSVRKSNSATKSIKYTIKKAATAVTKSSKYTLKTTPTKKTKSLAYHVRTIASAIQKSEKYCIKNIHTPQKQLKYEVKYSAPAITKQLKYEIKYAPSAVTKSVVYKVKAPASPKTKQIKYEVRTVASALTKSLKYEIRFTHSALTKSVKYTIKKSASAVTKQIIYTIKKSASAITKSEKYTVKITPGAKTKQLSYLVKATQTAIEKQLKYEVVISTLPIQKDLKYTIKTTPSAKQKSEKYTIKITPTAKTKQLKYEVVATIPKTITKQLEYRVTNQMTPIQKNSKYAVTIQNEITKQNIYRVIRPATPKTKQLKYCTIKKGSVTKQLRYKIEVGKPITKQLKYSVVRSSSRITKSLRYVVRIYPYVKKSSPYTKKSSPYKKL